MELGNFEEVMLTYTKQSSIPPTFGSVQLSGGVPKRFFFSSLFKLPKIALKYMWLQHI